MLNLINSQPDIDKIYFYAKDLCQAKHELLVNKHEGVDLKHYNDSRAFIEYPNDMDGIYENIKDYRSTKEPKILISFDHMIDDILGDRKLKEIVKELLCFVFITQSFFAILNNIRPNSKHYLIMEIPKNDSFNQPHLIIHQILTLKTL